MLEPPLVALLTDAPREAAAAVLPVTFPSDVSQSWEAFGLVVVRVAWPGPCWKHRGVADGAVRPCCCEACARADNRRGLAWEGVVGLLLGLHGLCGLTGLLPLPAPTT